MRAVQVFSPRVRVRVQVKIRVNVWVRVRIRARVRVGVEVEGDIQEVRGKKSWTLTETSAGVGRG